MSGLQIEINLVNSGWSPDMDTIGYAAVGVPGTSFCIPRYLMQQLLGQSQPEFINITVALGTSPTAIQQNPSGPNLQMQGVQRDMQPRD